MHLWSQSYQTLFLRICIIFLFFAVKLGHFIAHTSCVICYKHSSLTAKIEKQRYTKFDRIDSRNQKKFPRKIMIFNINVCLFVCDVCEFNLEKKTQLNFFFTLLCFMTLQGSTNSAKFSPFQWFPSFFCSRTPMQKKIKLAFTLGRFEKAFMPFSQLTAYTDENLAYPQRFLKYPWGYAYHRLGTAGLFHQAMQLTKPFWNKTENNFQRENCIIFS